jgi:hypothetical protein
MLEYFKRLQEMSVYLLKVSVLQREYLMLEILSVIARYSIANIIVIMQLLYKIFTERGTENLSHCC